MQKEKQKKTKSYDYSLKSKSDRAEYIEQRLGFIEGLPSFMLMGYSGSKREDESKYDKIPKMIEAYTTYYLESKDVESTRDTEYSFYINRREDMRRKNNKMLFGNSESFDGSGISDNNDSLSHSETYVDNNLSYDDYNLDGTDSEVLKYAIRSGSLCVKDYKKILSMSADFLYLSKNEELKEMVEQIIFNCAMNARDDNDRMTLKEFIQGVTLREIAEKVGVSKDTVDRKINKMLEWVRQD